VRWWADYAGVATKRLVPDEDLLTWA
jgi:hypothetical protein